MSILKISRYDDNSYFHVRRLRTSDAYFCILVHKKTASLYDSWISVNYQDGAYALLSLTRRDPCMLGPEIPPFMLDRFLVHKRNTAL